MNIPPQQPINQYSKEKAKAFFENYVVSFDDVKTRGYDNKSIFGIDISPQWDRSVASQQGPLISIDVPILENRRLLARVGDNNYYVNSLQKLIVVKQTEDDCEGAYLLTLIPDLEYSHNKPL